MATDLECPRCGASILMETDSERVACDECGARFKRKRKSPKSASADATSKSARPRKKPGTYPGSALEFTVSRRTALIVGGAVFGSLLLLIGGTLLWVLATGSVPGGGGGQHDPATGIARDNLGDVNVSHLIVNRVADGEIDWMSDEFVTIDSSSETGQIRFQLFVADSSARTVAGDGSESPPGEWLPLPVLPAVDRSALPPIHGRPNAWNNDSCVLITVDTERFRGSSFDNRYTARWQRFDLETGLPTSARFFVGEVERERDLLPSDNPDPSAALTPDGAYFACEKFGETGTVMVWDSDGVVLGTCSPSGDASPVDWLDWNSDGQLLTLADGVLGAWSIPDMDPVWSMADAPVSFAELSRQREWLAVAVENRIRVVDARTGERLGELVCDLEAGVRDIAISDNQQQLAAIHAAANDESSPRFPLQVWNLERGTAVRVDVLPADAVRREYQETMAAEPRVRSLQWLNENQLIVHGWGEELICDLYDLRSPRQLARFSSFEFSGNHIDDNTIFHGPANWLWLAPHYENNRSAPVSFLDEANEDHQPLLDWMQQADNDSPPITAVRIELDAADEERSQLWGQTAADDLAEAGVPIGPGDHVLRGRIGVTESDNTLEQTGGGRSVPVPMLSVLWELVAPDGTTVWHSVGGVYWSMYASEHGRHEGDRLGGYEAFDFTAANYWEMIVEEILEQDPRQIRASVPRQRLLNGLTAPESLSKYDLPFRLRIAGPDGETAGKRFGVERYTEVESVGLIDDAALPDDAPVPALDLRAEGSVLTLKHDSTGLSVMQYDRTTGEWTNAGAFDGMVEHLVTTEDLQQFAFLGRTGLTTFGLADQETRTMGSRQTFSSRGRLALSVSPAGRHVASHFVDYSDRLGVTVWDSAAAASVLKVETELPSVAACFSNDGKWFVVSDTKLWIRDTDTFEPVAELDGPFTSPELREHQQLVPRGVSFSPDGRTLAIWGELLWYTTVSDSLLWFYSLSADGEMSIVELPGVFRDRHLIRNVSFDEDGSRAAVHLAPHNNRSENPGGAVLYDVRKGVVVREWTRYGHGEITSVDISPDGSELAISVPGRILVFDVGTPLTELNAQAPRPPATETGETAAGTPEESESDTTGSGRSGRRVPQRRPSSRRSRGR